jgi:hypothetical protein
VAKRFETTVTVPATATTSAREVRIVCLLHRTETAADRLIDKEFYDKYGTGVPEGTHYEMEVLEPPDKIPGVTIHIHIHPVTKQHFLCWTGRLPTEDAAKEIFLIWAVGTAYSIVYGKDFLPLVTNPSTFVPMMEHDFGITHTDVSES